MPSQRNLLPARDRLRLSLQWGYQDVLARAALPRHFVLRCLRHTLQPEVAQAVITVRIVGEAEGKALNQQYRGKNYATNVLTFPYTPAPHLCADLVLCAPVMAQETLDQGIALQAHYAHLLVHGALHAQGFDHETSVASAQAMEEKEVSILLGLGFVSPYGYAATPSD